MSARDYGDKTTMLGIPMAPLMFCMSAFLFLNGLIHAAQLWGLLARRSETE